MTVDGDALVVSFSLRPWRQWIAQLKKQPKKKKKKEKEKKKVPSSPFIKIKKRRNIISSV